MTLPASAVANSKDNNNNSTFSNPVELPPMETTYLPDRQKEEAFNSLEFLNDNEAVRCQCCNNWIRIVGKLQKPKSANDRISTLQKRIKWLEFRLSHNISSSNSSSYYNNNAKPSSAIAVTREIKEAKEELARLEAEDAKWDRFRHLPLYSSKCTD